MAHPGFKTWLPLYRCGSLLIELQHHPVCAILLQIVIFSPNEEQLLFTVTVIKSYLKSIDRIALSIIFRQLSIQYNFETLV